MSTLFNLNPVKEISLHPELAAKFAEELKKLEEKKGVSKSLELSMRVQKLHDANEELVAIFEKFGDERTFEVFLALLGYDKTKFEMRDEPLDEKILLALLEPDLTEKDFYYLIYTPHIFSKEDLWNIIFSKELVDAEEYFGLIAMIAKSSSSTITQVCDRTRLNRQVLKSLGLLESASVAMKHLCRVYPIERTGEFENFVKSNPNNKAILAEIKRCVKGSRQAT